MGFKKVIKKLLKLTPYRLSHVDSIKSIESNEEYMLSSYAQEGEDLVLNRFLETKTNGFYVDIGAHHPKRFSNTYLFYKMGWRGINMDPMPGSMLEFQKHRPNDINLEIGISDKAEEMTYYLFNEPALNTFSKKEAKAKDGLRDYRIIEEIKVKTCTLAEVLDKHVPRNTVIDFMTIDVEGLDLQVLQSNNWNVYRPKLLLIEDLDKQSLELYLGNSKLARYMQDQHYELVAKTFNTLFYSCKLS